MIYIYPRISDTTADEPQECDFGTLPVVWQLFRQGRDGGPMDWSDVSETRMVDDSKGRRFAVVRADAG